MCIAYVEMNSIGDYANFVIYRLETERTPSQSVWMVPGSWEGRDQFKRKRDDRDVQG